MGSCSRFLRLCIFGALPLAIGTASAQQNQFEFLLEDKAVRELLAEDVISKDLMLAGTCKCECEIPRQHGGPGPGCKDPHPRPTCDQQLPKSGISTDRACTALNGTKCQAYDPYRGTRPVDGKNKNCSYYP